MEIELTSIKCPIWNSAASESRDSDADQVHVFSHRAGGLYSITGTAVSVVRSMSDEEKARLTSWLYEQRRFGINDPLVTSEVIKAARARRPLETSIRIERALRFFDGMRLGDSLTLEHGDVSTAEPAASIFAAITECIDDNDTIALLKLLEELDYLKDDPESIGSYNFTPTAAGWLKLEELRRVSVVGQQAFVAMWFNDQTNDAYEHGIAPAIRKTGFEPLRIDKKEHANKIDDEIIAEIRRSRFIICDFTCEPKQVRGGVYFEAGFAAGLGIQVIWTCRESSLSDLHFDTRQYSHIVWTTPEDLRIKLEARIGAVVGFGPLQRSSP